MMEFSGERYVPAVPGQIKYEHLHRYALSLEFVAGKDVLDLAAGEGYGAAILAGAAKSVTGVDLDPAAVDHAKKKYLYRNLNFLVGRCESVPLPDASVDVVTSFETIEHHDRHEEMLLEIRRVLRPGGVLILSSPNRLAYSDEPGYSNPFHIKELYYDELRDLLKKHFKYHHIYGQKMAAGSFIFPLREEGGDSFKAFSGQAEQIKRHIRSLPSPTYFIVICSDDNVVVSHQPSSIYLDGQDELLKNLAAEIVEPLNELKAQVESSASALARTELSYQAQISRLSNELSEAETRLSDYEEQLIRRSDELSKVRAAYEGQLQQREESLAEAREQLSSYEAYIEQQAENLIAAQSRLLKKEEVLRWIQMSRSWKAASVLQRARQGLYQFSHLNEKVRHKFHLPGQDAFAGHIDSPGKMSRISRYLEFSGWVYSKAAPVIAVEAFLDNFPLGAAQYGQARPDVSSASPHIPTDCGYSGRFPVEEFLTGRRTLRVRVTDAEGNIKDYLRTLLITEPARRPSNGNLLISVPEHGNGEAAEKMDAPFHQDQLSAAKKSLTAMAKISLDSFLNSNATIEIPQHAEPEVSIILVLYNRAELTLQCLYSILKSNTRSFELIIVDNASTDETRQLLKRIKGAQIIENERNVHYLLGCNQAARLTRSEFILLLNNDTQVLADSISSALQTIKSALDIGAVGGKIILPCGALQEAGSIIWRDGSCLGYGRGDSPSAPPYMFKRDVDYCSGAFLLTRRDLFLEGGGFDEDYAPAYYEETDYCVRLWKRGKRVVYDPRSVVLHYEFASSVSEQSAINQAITNKPTFVSKNQDWLGTQHRPSQQSVLTARTARLSSGSMRILFIDDRVPHVQLGSGFPRSNRILSEMVEMGHFVTLYPLNFPQEEWADVYLDVPQEVEVMLDYGLSRLEEFFKEREGYYDLIFVSRPHNMAALDRLFSEKPRLRQRARIVYDAEALFTLRDIERMRLEGEEPSPEEKRKLIDKEVTLARNCSCIITVSESEGEEFIRHGFKCVHTLGHSLMPAATPNGMDERRDILFVGAMHNEDSPNADSMIWFNEEIFPLIRKELGEDIKLRIAGPVSPALKDKFNNGSVQLAGRLDDLTPLYAGARIFIAPTRFSAGIPHKVHEAAAYGVPVVATGLTGMQLGWKHEEELLLADDAEGFAAACIRLYRDRPLWNRLRQNALDRVRIDCSPERFTKKLREIIGQGLDENRVSGHAARRARGENAFAFNFPTGPKNFDGR